MLKTFWTSSLVALVAMTVSSQPAAADTDKLFVCASPILAERFQSELVSIAQTGVKLSLDIATQLAAKVGPNGLCKRVEAERFEPYSFSAGALGIFDDSDLQFVGFAMPDYYTLHEKARRRGLPNASAVQH